MENSRKCIHDGDTIKFTGADISGEDAVFTLNDDPMFVIRYSQLASFFFDKSLEFSDHYIPHVFFKDGETLDLLPYDVKLFWDKVKGKSFTATVKTMARLNLDSKADAVRGKSLEELFKLVRQLIANKQLDSIKAYDLLVEAPMYELTEK